MKKLPVVRNGMGVAVPLSWKEKVLCRLVKDYIPVRNRIPLRDVCRKIGHTLEWLQEHWISDGTLRVWFWRGSWYTQRTWVEMAMHKRHPNYQEILDNQRERLA